VKTFTTLYRTQPASRLSTFAISSTATGCAILMLAAGHSALAAAPAAAPAAGDADLEEVVVTGIRAAIESAISVKKNADTIVEAISAEDIGKLPDTSIAESLARLPGVTAQRDRDGNATNVSIRGLGPDFNGYLLNGREQTSIGDSRAVDLSVYPAELIAGATVYKSGDAGLMTAGLAGTIDNKLVDPLAYHNMVIAANAEKTRNSIGNPVEGKGKKYTLAYIDQFADRKLGLAIGLVHSDTSSNSLANGSWGNSSPVYSDNGVTQIANGTGLPSINIPFAGGLGFQNEHKNDKRDGGAVVLKFAPNDAFTSEFDGYYGKIKTNHKIAAIKGGTGNGPINNAVISGGKVVSGTFNIAAGNLIGYSENIFDDDTIQSYGWNNTLKFADTWSVSLDLSHNSAKRVERDIEAYGEVLTGDTLSFTNGGATVPSFTFGSPLNYTDPTKILIQNQDGWSGVHYPVGSPLAGQQVPQAGYDKGPTVTDKLDAFRLDFQHDLGKAGLFSGYSFGVNYTKRTKERITDEGVLIGPNGVITDRIPYPGSAYVEPNVGGTGLSFLTFDPQVGLWPGVTLLRKFNNDILSKTWTVDEKVTTGYAKLKIDTQAGSIPVRGNVGVQIVNTDQSSGGYRASIGSGVSLTNPAGGLSTDGTKYTDFLPSLNLTGDLGNGNLLRFATGVQIARANLTDLRNSLSASMNTSVTPSLETGSSGNPRLKPFKAKTLDISYEKYFQSKAYVSGALFYKKLDSYIVPQTIIGYDFTTINSQIGLVPPPGSSGAIGVMTQTVNGSGGSIKGLELSASIPFSLLTSWLEGFGITASYSSTLSSVNLPNFIGQNPTQGPISLSIPMQLPGLSHINEKVVFYYERAGFSAFVADAYRSSYVGSVSNTTVGGYPTLINIAPQQWISAQIGYEFQSGPVKGLAFRFEGNNLNKPIYKEYKYDGSLNSSNQTGAIYAFKVAYKFQN
jgi:iron complex outermembrane receptor protein